jgi:hypothetical protein
MQAIPLPFQTSLQEHFGQTGRRFAIAASSIGRAMNISPVKNIRTSLKYFLNMSDHFVQ